MKKKLLFALIASFTSISGWSACTYNLDLTQAALNQGVTPEKVFPIRQGQKLAYKLMSTPNEITGYVATSLKYYNQALLNPGKSIYPGDKVLPNTGVLAFEYNLKLPTQILSGNEALMIFPIIADTTVGNQRAVGMTLGYFNNRADQPNSHELFIIVGDNYVQKFPVTGSTNGYQRFGFYVNQDTKKVGLIVNGVNKGYIESFTNKPSAISFQMGSGYTRLAQNSPVLNQEVSIELITDKNQFQFTYPTGTKDICGNVI